MRDIDEVIASLEKRLPNVKCEQLRVKHAGPDDDGLWYFELEACEDRVQVESWNGMCPFIIEDMATSKRIASTTVQETIETVASMLHRK